MSKREMPRPCVVDDEKAMCHLLYVACWTHGESAMIGGFPAGQETRAMALIERTDGSLENVDAVTVRFTDVEDGDGR